MTSKEEMNRDVNKFVARKRKQLGNEKNKALDNKNGLDKEKRWGNAGIKGVGVNSPAMMEARAKKLGYYPQEHKNYGDVYEA